MRTLGVTVLLFIFLPRFGQVGWIGAILQTKQTVGFSDKVDLGEFGQIMENPGEVMRIRFFDQDNGAPYNVCGAIYLRGAVLLNYQRGQWSVGRPAFAVGNPTLDRRDPLPQHLVRQECIIEGLDRPELFYVAPYVALNSDTYITVDESRLRLLRSENYRAERFRYELGTTALVEGRQQPLTPILMGEDYDAALRIAAPDDPDGLPNLVRLAQSWIDESGLPAEDRAGRARYLERKLAASGMFTYSLENQNRDPAMDPIEDFLTNHRAGHCEFFRHRAVPHAPQPAHSRADRCRLSHRRMEPDRPVLSGPTIARPHLGGMLLASRPDAQRTAARRRRLELVEVGRLAAIGSHA